MAGINFSSEYARKANFKDNQIHDVEKLVGRPQPDQYSADLSLFVLDAGVTIMVVASPGSDVSVDLGLCATQTRAGEPEADAYHQAVDNVVAKLIDLGATVAITADHGMADKSNADGTPRVVYLEDELNSRFGTDALRVICPIADPFVRHHGALGSFVRVHLRRPGKRSAMMAFARTPTRHRIGFSQRGCLQPDLISR